MNRAIRQAIQTDLTLTWKAVESIKLKVYEIEIKGNAREMIFL